MLDPTRAELLTFLRAQTCDDPDAAFDVEEAAYWLAADCHGGQWSNLYEALCASPYSPGPISSGPENAWLYEAGLAWLRGEVDDI